MAPFATSTFGDHWPLSYCQGFGANAATAFNYIKSSVLTNKRTQFFSIPAACTATVTGLLTSGRYYASKNSDNLGWIIEARLHFGHRLSRYVGVSIFIKNNYDRLAFLARISGLVLFVGVGSYLAYRLCLKLFGCRDVASLLNRLRNGRVETGEKNVENYCACKRQCRRRSCKRCRTEDSCGNDVRHVGVDFEKNKKRRRLHFRRNEEDFESSDSETDESEAESENADSGSTASTSIDDGQNRPNETQQSVAMKQATSRSYSLEKTQPIDAGKPTTEDAPGESRKERRWQNVVRKRTNALDATDFNRGSCSDEECSSGASGFSVTRSPPPIHRHRGHASPLENRGPGAATSSFVRATSTPAVLLTPHSRAPSVASMSVQSILSSQQLIWDPMCTPEDRATFGEDLLTFFADLPTGELVQRFLDGLSLGGNNNNGSRCISPGLSETTSEMSLAVDRQLGDCTAENFERLESDFCDLRTDVEESYAELTTFLEQRSECLQSDSRVFYQSVVVDEEEESWGDNSKPSNPISGLLGFESPCKRSSTETHRRSLKRRRHSPPGENQQIDLSDSRTPADNNCNENQKSVLSLDTGYITSSYHTQFSSTGCQSSPSSVYGMSDEENKEKRRAKRPMDLPLLTVECEPWRPSPGILHRAQMKESENFYASREKLTLSPTPSTVSREEENCAFTKRPPSAISLEWEDEMADDGDAEWRRKKSPFRKSLRRRRESFEAVDIGEFLKTYYSIDDLETKPKIAKLVRQLAKRGYQRILLPVTQECTLGHFISDRPTTSKMADFEALILACLKGVSHFRWPIFKCQSFHIVPEVVDICIKRCSFLTDRCAAYFRSNSAEQTRAYILRCMQKLWQLHQSVQGEELDGGERDVSTLFSIRDSENSIRLLIDGVKILMTLRSLETYEEILFTRHTSCAFYTEFFRVYTPASYAEKRLFCPDTSSALNWTLDEMDIALLADTLGIRLEMYRPYSSQPETVAVYPELESNSRFPKPKLLLLEPLRGDGLFLPLA